MINTKDLQSLKINKLFSSGDKYIIPIYQRNYAWGKGQVEQLIQDILDFSEEYKDKPYYIGTLVVFERKETNEIIYETIDGQQRLTTLSILLSILKNKVKEKFEFTPLLSYESRELSNKTFEDIYTIQEDKKDDIFSNGDEYNATMKNAYETICTKLENLKADNKLEKFKNYLLNYVEILRVSVPEDTDLNHYFEIMNNRGEQLEKHEILKSNMLSKLDEKERLVFAKIWDACSDMSRYVQYGFTNEKTTKYREEIFGKYWTNLKVTNFDSLLNIYKDELSNSNEVLLLDNIINPINKFEITSNDDRDMSERFTSPINFQNFLLHVLKVQIANDKKYNVNDNKLPLDDKRLLESFKEFIDNKDFIKEFGFNLLKLKFLFDNYIIKREYNDNNGEDGEWSLKKLLQGNSSAQYNNSFDDENNEQSNRKLLMLLSMFHVSNPSQIYKHWLSGVLQFLVMQDINDMNAFAYITYLENLANKFFKRYIATNEISYDDIIFSENSIDYDIDKKLLNLGTNVENFIFNYLDYLLWKKDENIFKGFSFTFRSSIEHFYPQNPLDGQRRLQNEFPDKDYLNSFGNLCLISASKNSKFSNLQPEGKKSHYHKFDGVSPKQYLMMKKSENWWNEEIKNHQKEMEVVLGI